MVKQPMLTKKRNLKKGEMIPLYFDEAFKMMYANPKYIEVLTLLISRILKVEYKDIEGKVELLPTTVPNRTLGEIKSERDIVVSVRSNPEYKIVMELNIKRELFQNIVNRNLYYACGMFGGLEESKQYQDMRIIYQVNFNNYFIDEQNKPVIDLYQLRNAFGNILSDRLQVLNINIDECYKLWYNKSYKGKFEPYEEDLLLLCAAMNTSKMNEFEECLKEVRTNPKIIQSMEEAVENMTQDEHEWGRLYNKEEEEARMWEGIRRETREKALKEGIEQGVYKVAKGMLKRNVPIETISEYTGLTIDQIKALYKEN